MTEAVKLRSSVRGRGAKSNASGRFDELSPDSFKYVISAREIAA